MKILSVDADTPSPNHIQQAVEVLKDGGLIIYPTDTSYGLGVDPSNPSAMAELLRLKGRDRSKGISLLVANLAMIETIAVLSQRTQKILEHYLPGPYSFLLVNKNFTYCPLNAVMVRIPNYRVTQQLADQFSGPYTTTSANYPGEPPAYSLAEMEASFLHPETITVVPDLILDAGELPRKPSSTIVDLTQWPPTIIRQGDGVFDWHQFA